MKNSRCLGDKCQYFTILNKYTFSKYTFSKYTPVVSFSFHMRSHDLSHFYFSSVIFQALCLIDFLIQDKLLWNLLVGLQGCLSKPIDFSLIFLHSLAVCGVFYFLDICKSREEELKGLPYKWVGEGAEDIT